MNSLLLIMSLFCQAKEFTPALGYTNDQERPFFTVSDFSTFPINYRDKFGFYRYGFGNGNMFIGTENIGYGGRSRNGFTVIGLDSKKGIAPHLGIDIFDGEFKVNSNRAYNNYYMYQPAIALGVMSDVGWCGIMVNAKFGSSVTNYYIPSGWTPKYDTTYGYSMLLDIFETSLTYEVLHFYNIKREILDINMWNNIHLFKEKDQLNETTGIGIKKRW